MKILVVDDEPVLLEQLRETLIYQRYNVDTADDGESALDKIFDNLKHTRLYRRTSHKGMKFGL